jgi:hypothetical protein
MKRILLPLIFACAIPAMLRGQNPDGPETPESSETTEARIIGEIPDGTPVEPAPPPAKLVVLPEDVIVTLEVRAGQEIRVIPNVGSIKQEIPEVGKPGSARMVN